MWLSHPSPWRHQPIGAAPAIRLIVRFVGFAAIATFAAFASFAAPSASTAGPSPKALAQTVPLDGLAVVDQMWGDVSGMVGVGDLLYVAQGARLLVIEGWRTAAPTLIGRSPVLAGRASKLAVEGDRAAIAIVRGGVVVLDVADPRAPRVITTIPARRETTAVALAGDRLWAAYFDEGLVVYDLAANPPVELHSVDRRVEHVAASNGRVAAILESNRANPDGQLLIWPDGANSSSIATDVVEVIIPPAINGVAVVDGNVIVAHFHDGLVVHEEAAEPPWSATRQLDLACPPFRMVANDGRAIVQCDYQPELIHVVRIPPSGPLSIDASVAFPRWFQSGWIDADGLAIHQVDDALRTFSGVLPDGGLAGLAAIDLGPNVVTSSAQDGPLVGLSGNWGLAWQARVLSARVGGVELTSLPTAPTVSLPYRQRTIDAIDGRFVLGMSVPSASGPETHHFEVGVASLDDGTWQLSSTLQHLANPGYGLVVLPPLTPGGPSAVVVPHNGIRAADLIEDVLGPFDQRLPWPASDAPSTISSDGQRVWFGTQDAAIGIERRADGWHTLSTLPLPPEDDTLSVFVVAAGERVFTMHEGTLVYWNIANPVQPERLASLTVAGEWFGGFGFTDSEQQQLWVGTEVGLHIIDTSSGQLTLLQHLDTHCFVTAWLPAPDGVIVPAWGCGALILRTDGTAPPPAPLSVQPGVDLPGVPSPTATEPPDATATPTASPPSATSSPDPTSATTHWTIHLPLLYRPSQP